MQADRGAEKKKKKKKYTTRCSSVGADGDDLLLAASASAPLPAAVLDLLSRHNPGILVLLHPGSHGWSANDWREFFEERAAIAEFDGGLPRGEAEAHAFAWCAGEWLNHKFVPSTPGHCFACGGHGQAHEPLLPHGIEPAGHVWLHDHSWPAGTPGGGGGRAGIGTHGALAAGQVSRDFVSN